jgi:2,3-bisphosphoglycerate-independent phosphoglycerate mutase
MPKTMHAQKNHRPIVLIILDGWGFREEKKYNAIAAAKTPYFNQLWEKYPHTLVCASCCRVGLPEGQMGNSEVGHLNLGAGRTVYQDLSRISNAILDESFFENAVLKKAVDDTIHQNKAVHIFGLLSDGGIHSHEKQIHAMVKLAASCGVKKLYVHAFLDGRDTPPKSAETFIKNLEEELHQLKCGRIASLIGRFYAMDRDKRWDRVQAAYDMLTLGTAVRSAPTALEGIRQAYQDGETDEFVKATVIHSAKESPITIEDGDSVIFMNYRADRAREITRAFNEPDFKEFPRQKIVKLAQYVALTEYDKTFTIPVAFPPERLTNTLGEYLSAQHLTQLRIAETEKYAHVTFFFDGGEEHTYEGEDKILIPSPKVAHYDETPEMSAPIITEKLVEAIRSKRYDVIICNYANADMIGHTGNFEATVKAIEYLDHCLEQVIPEIIKVGGEAIVTADHGNAEMMFDDETRQSHTAHTSNPVPLIYVGRSARLMNDAALGNIAPTLLQLLDLSIPSEMTAESMIEQLQEDRT